MITTGIFLTTLLISCKAAYTLNNVVQIGNRIAASASGVDVPGVSFLVDDLILSEGILFAYSAFFRSDQPVRFQIWRPESTQNDGRNFVLLSETRTIPSVINQREDVYIESKLGASPCVRVRQGDRLGVYLEGAPGAVAYSFDASNPMALGHKIDNLSKPVKVGENVRFDPLTFPYDFNLAAYLYLNLTGTDPAETYPPCPKGLLIPQYIAPTLPPTAPPTGEPGATGATGPYGFQGPQGKTGFTGPSGPVGATGIQGPIGQVGFTGATGPQGLTGPKGPVGATGAMGPKGDKGDAGPAGPPGPAAIVGNANSASFLSHTFLEQNPLLNFILLIWLAVVTLVLIIVIIVLAVVAKRRRQSVPKARHTGLEWKPSWQGVLRSEEEIYSSQDSIISDPSSGSDFTVSTMGSNRRLPDYAYEPNTGHLPAFAFDDTLKKNSVNHI